MLESITVIICTYNNCQLLENTLKTLEKQETSSGIKWSVLVVSNNCNDQTSYITQKYIQNNPILFRVVEEPTQGLAYARRRGVQETTSELIAFVDDDCLLSCDWVEQAVNFFQQHPEAGAVGSRVQLLWEVEPPSELLQFQGYLSSYDLGDSPQQVNTYLVGAGLVVKRSALLDSGWLDKITLVGRNGKTLTAGDDSEIVLRIRNAGYQLWYNPCMQIEHYIPKKRISIDYLCRLLYGIGKTRPVLYVLHHNLKITTLVKLNFFVNSIYYIVRIWISMIYRNLFKENSSTLAQQRIYLSDALGNLEGVLELVFNK